MPDFTFSGPQGQKITITGPEGATLEDAAKRFDEMKAAQPDLFKEPPGTFEDIGKAALHGAAAGPGGLGDVQRMIRSGVDYLGLPRADSPHAKFTPSSAQTEETLAGSVYEPTTTAGRYTKSVARNATDPLTWLGPGGWVVKAASGLASALGAQLGEDVGGAPGRVIGGVLGGVGGATAHGVATGARSPISARTPELTEATDRLVARGITPTAGQATGRSNVQLAEGRLGSVPLAGEAAWRFQDRAQQQINRNLFESAGHTGTRATQAEVNAMFTNLDRQFDQVKARNNLDFTVASNGRLIMQDVNDAIRRYEAETPRDSRLPIFETVHDNLVGRLTQGSMSGVDYQAWRSQLSDMAHRQMRQTQNVTAARGLFDIVDALDSAMERSMQAAGSPDLGRFRELRQQWGNAATITEAIGRGDKANDFTRDGLVTALERRNQRGYARGQGDLAELARDLDLVMKPLPEHRPWWLAAHGASALASPGGRLLMSGPIQRRLRNQAGPPWNVGSSAVRGAADALSPAEDDDALR